MVDHGKETSREITRVSDLNKGLSIEAERVNYHIVGPINRRCSQWIPFNKTFKSVNRESLKDEPNDGMMHGYTIWKRTDGQRRRNL